MPSSQTITAFYTFTQNTKAIASEVNTNFNVFRGHIIPVNTDTASASNLTHDLGESTHRWANGYISALYLGNTTSSWSIKDASPSVGDLQFNISGASAFSFKRGHNAWTMSSHSQEATVDKQSSLTDIANLDVTITTYGQPVEIRLIPSGAGAETVTGGSLLQARNFSGGSVAIEMSLMRGANTLTLFTFGGEHTGSQTESSTTYNFPPASIYHFDDSVTAGTYTYKLAAKTGSGRLTVYYCQMMLKLI